MLDKLYIHKIIPILRYVIKITHPLVIGIRLDITSWPLATIKHSGFQPSCFIVAKAQLGDIKSYTNNSGSIIIVSCNIISDIGIFCYHLIFYLSQQYILTFAVMTSYVVSTL